MGQIIMENQIIGKRDLVMAMSAMNRTGFDFVGRYEGLENGCLLLANPLVMEYDDKRVLQRLAPLHLPFGTVDITGQKNILAVPLEGLAYFVSIPAEGSDWMHMEYESAFSGSV